MQLWYNPRMAAKKQITVRMPVELVSDMESRGGTTVYIIEAVREKLARDKQAEIAAGLRCLADNPDEEDFSALIAAQAKVMARVD